MKKNKKAEQRKGDKLGPRWLGPYLITAVHDNQNYMVADPKMGKVLATRCLQSECKLYIDLVLGTTEKHYQGILDIFSKTEQYFLLLDKLLPDSVMASSRSEENVVLTNFQHKGVSVLVYPNNFIWAYWYYFVYFGRCHAI